MSFTAVNRARLENAIPYGVIPIPSPQEYFNLFDVAKIEVPLASWSELRMDFYSICCM
jgi:hypothetical protein